eukprot:11430624-Prorocentrum_lima.AAC.1
MTSSLVGSEMCIRDRVAKVVGGANDLPIHQFEGARFAPCRAAGLRPVSYTHLTLPTICSV